MTKKIFAMFLAVLMVVSMLPTSVFAAENATVCDVCELKHATKCPECGGKSYTLVKPVEATCNHEGGYVVKCSDCSAEYFIEETKKLDTHTWVDVAEQAPVACADGVIAHRECSGCELKQFQLDGKWVEMTEANKDKWTIKNAEELKAHAWTNPTDVVCGTEDGKFTPVCSICGLKGDKVDVSEKEHSWKVTGTITAATATENGKATAQCEHCYATKEITVYFEHDHNIVEVAKKDATCTETGYMGYYYCTICNQKYSTNENGVDTVEGKTLADYEISEELFNKVWKDEEDLEEDELNGYTLEMIDHVYPATVTCKDTTAVCVNCHKRYEIDVNDNNGWTMDGHKVYGADGKTLVPVSFENCKESVKCVVCEKNLTVSDILTEKEMNAAGYYHNWKITQEYECVEGTAKCETCGATKTVKAENHRINGTCNNTASTCKICGKSVKELGLNHTYDPEKAVTEKATCTENSYIKNECIYCGYENTVYGDDVLGHILQTVVIPATCQSVSKTIVYCTREDCTANLNTTLTTDYPDQLWSGLKYQLNAGESKVWVVFCRVNMSGLGIINEIKLYLAENETALKAELKNMYGEVIGYTDAVYPEAVDGGFALSVIINDEKLYVGYDSEFNAPTLNNEPITLTKTTKNGAEYITYAYGEDGNAIYMSYRDGTGYFSAGGELHMPKGSPITMTLADGGLRIVSQKNGESVNKDGHVWVKLRTYTAATCTEDEVQLWRCSCEGCNAEKYVPVEGTKLNHKDKDGNSLNHYILVGSEAEEDGKTTLYDATALANLKKSNSNKLPVLQQAGTCSKAGYYYTVCSECHATKKVNTAKDSTNHTWNEKAPTLDHNNQSAAGVWSCKDCKIRVYELKWDGAKEIYESREEAKKAHNTLGEATKVQDGSCTQLAIYKAKCSCGDTVKYYVDSDENGKFGEHAWATMVVMKEYEDWMGTYMAPAYVENHNEICYDGEFCENEDHYLKVVIDESNYFTAATCLDKSVTYSWGCKREDCSEKHYAYDKDGNKVALGDYVKGEKYANHKWVENSKYVEPSHDNPAYKDTDNFVCKYQCSVCKATKSDGTESIIAKFDPTCTEVGYEMYLCWCGNIHIRNYQAALGHNYVVDENAKSEAATCTKVGYHFEYCSVCNPNADSTMKSATAYQYAYKKVIDAKIAHVNADEEEFWDSCLDKVTDRHCLKCCNHENKKNEDGTDHVCDEKCACVIATNHNYEAKIQKPTCTEKGYTYWQCACGKQKVDENGELEKSLETKANGHYIPVVDTEKADYYGYKYVELSNGKFQEYLEYTAPTYETEGYCKFYCKNCKSNVEMTLDKLNGLGLTLDADEYTYGSLVSVKIDLVNIADKISGGELTLNFGSNLTYVDVADSLDATFYTSGVVEDGALKLQFVSLSGDVDVSEVTYLTTVYFRYLPETEVNTEDAIKISASGAKYDTKNADDENVSKDLRATGIAKADVRVFGDFNADGKFDRLDLYAALKMFELDAEKTYDVTMDANYDGVVDVADIQTMLGILTGEIDIDDNVREFMSKDEIKAHFGTYCEKCEKWYIDGCNEHKN